MRIAKPLLLILTPPGVSFGLYEARRLAGAPMILLTGALGTFSVAMGSLIAAVRREGAAEPLGSATWAQSDAASPLSAEQTNPQ